MMEWDVLTLDTSIFGQNGWKLEEGLLAKVAQFSEGPVRFVLSEVVYREIEGHMRKEAKKTHDSMKKARKDFRNSRLMSQETFEQAEKLFETALSPDDAVKKRLKKFQDAALMDIIPVTLASGDEVIKRYFASSAPFGTSAKKKNEFPDAFALLSMETWAENENKKILAVSTDPDWISFGEQSPNIHVDRDLHKALEKLQQHVEGAKATLSRVLSGMNKGEHPRLRQELADSIANTVSHLDVWAEGESAFHCEGGSVKLSLQDFRFPDLVEGDELSIVLMERRQVAAWVSLYLQAKAECEFSFSKWDAVDREYVSMGNSRAETDGDFCVSAIMTFEGDLSAPTPELKLSHLDLIDVLETVNFGEVEPEDGEVFYLDRYRQVALDR